MCFSASASFSAGVVLTVIGIASIRKVKKTSQIIFASISVLFGIQQFTEGFLWLALTDPAFAVLEAFTTYNYLSFAQILWPFWVPLAIYKLEQAGCRKKLLLSFIVLGGMVSVYLAYCLVQYQVSANIIGCHVAYIQDYPKVIGIYSGILYILATIAPLCFSSVKRMWIVGVLIFASYVVTKLFYVEYFTSVWCFFAAIISLSMYGIVRGLNKVGK